MRIINTEYLTLQNHLMKTHIKRTIWLIEDLLFLDNLIQ